MNYIIEEMTTDQTAQSEGVAPTLSLTIDMAWLRSHHGVDSNFEVFKILNDLDEGYPLTDFGKYVYNVINENKESKVAGVQELLSYYEKSDSVDYRVFACYCGKKAGQVCGGTRCHCYGKC
ncbi:hypothetical protein NT6N_31630 [Oceaniferula spumae]|uniref:Uncharacterized protein n=1 Tax=Oceaniferula spumae TaxID=2979115 RepID=A0AAT9FQ66_9BACT